MTSAFNGGPGAAAAWLHLGVLGARRVVMGDVGALLPPPYALADNAETLLAESDLVFIDPVSTGYSRAVKGGKPGVYHGYQGDLESVAEVIRLCEETDCPIIDAEVKVLGFNHAQLAGVLCEDWGIPDMLTVPIRFHHNPMDAPEEPRAAAQLCHVANGMAYGLCLDVTEEGPRYMPAADLTELPYTDERAVQALGLDMPRLLSLMEEAGRAALEQESLFRNAGGP